MLLGVDISRNTYIHAIDEQIDATVYGTTEITVTDYDGNSWVHKELLTKGPAAATFVRYMAALDEVGAIKYGKIGNADSMLIDARKCFDVVMGIRQNEVR